MMKKILALTALVAMPLLATAGPGDWAYKGVVEGPVWSNVRIAVDSNNDVYVSGDKTVWKSTDIAAAVAADPLVAPTWSTIIDGTDTTGHGAAINGYQGLAIDPSDDSIYCVCDGDGTNPGRIDKFAADGTADGTIANIQPPVGDRLGSAQVMSDGNLLLANHSGMLNTMNATTGVIGTWHDTTSGTFLRDIDLKGDTVFGCLSGSSISITGGSAADITGYTTVASIQAGTTSTTWDVNAGVEYFAADDTVMATNFNDRAIYVSAASDSTLVQTVDFNDASTDVAFKVSDVIAFSTPGTDYLIATAAGSTGLFVWTKANTSDVNDWTMLD